jgi:CBS domain-containing protein
MNTVMQIIGSKIDQVTYTMEPSTTVHEAVRLMVEKNIGALVVVKNGEVVGIVSERDLARKLVLMARSPIDTLLGDIMSSPVMCVRPHQTSDECMALMTQSRLRHLPVMDNDQPIGLISIEDLVKVTIKEQQFIIEQLEHATLDLITSAGLRHTWALNRTHVYRRINQHEIKRYDEIFSYLPEYSLLGGEIPDAFKLIMDESSSESFASGVCLAQFGDDCRALDGAHNGNGRGNTMAFEAEAK